MNAIKPDVAVTQFSQGMRRVECIIYHDGDIIAHYRDDQTQQDYILSMTGVKWNADETMVEAEHWLTAQISVSDLELYVTGQMSLRDVWSESKQLYACQGQCMGYFWKTDGAEGVAVKFADLDPRIIPAADSYVEQLN